MPPAAAELTPAAAKLTLLATIILICFVNEYVPFMKTFFLTMFARDLALKYADVYLP